jgi:hypothetical protein
MSLLGDDQTAGVRRLLLENAGLLRVEAFPQKDEPRNRVFEEAKLATAVFLARSIPTGELISVTTHPGRRLEEISAVVAFRSSEPYKLDSKNIPIPTCTQQDLQIALSIIDRASTRRLRDYCKAFQGEVNETTDGKRGFVSYDPSDGPQVLRGSAICLYVIREPSQGEPMFLREAKFVSEKDESIKARHYLCRRAAERRTVTNTLGERSECRGENLAGEEDDGREQWRKSSGEYRRLDRVPAMGEHKTCRG